MKSLTYLFIFVFIAAFAGDTIRPGLESTETEYYIENQIEEQLVNAIKAPLLEGKNVKDALQDWFDGRLLDSKGKKTEAIATAAIIYMNDFFMTFLIYN